MQGTGDQIVGKDIRSTSWRAYKRRTPRSRYPPWTSTEIKEHLQDVQCPCGIKPSYELVYKVVSQVDSNRRKIVQSLRFGGFLDFRELLDNFEQFGFGLLGKVDDTTLELVVEGDRRIMLGPEQVRKIFGIPSFGRSVRDNGVQRDRKAADSVAKYAMRSAGARISLESAHAVVQANHNLGSNPVDADVFRVAFVFFMMAHVLAPSYQHGIDASMIWPALLKMHEIHNFNWAAYVVEDTLKAAGNTKLQVY